MTLLWFDSLHYVSTTRLTQVYPLATGFTVGASHPHSGKTSIQASSAELDIPANAGNGFGEETLFIGYRLKVPTAPFSYFDHILPRTGGGTELIRVQLGPANDGRVAFRVISGDSQELLFEASPFDCTTRHVYVEWRIKLAANGAIELRLDGVQQAFIENVDTLNGSAFNWDHVYMSCGETVMGVVPVYTFSDLYLADGTPDALGREQTFLGPSEVTRMFPAKAQLPIGWAPSLQTPAKRYLVCMHGQSNINGRGNTSNYTGAGRATNTKVKIWDHTLPTPAWVDVTPGAACNNVQKTWASEMNFAELVAQLHETVEPNAPAEIYIIRYGIDASYVVDVGIPGSGPLTWNPNVPNNISDAALTIINAAVGALSGGWSSFERCDILWMQGESEASGLGIGSFGAQNYIAGSNQVFDHFEANIPVTVEWHRAMAQNIPNVAWVDTYLEAVQNLQDGGQLRGRLIETRDLIRFNNDGIHMGEEDMDIFARRFFLSWLDACLFTRYITDDFFNDPSLDDLWIGSDTANTTVEFRQAPELHYDLMHNPVLFLNNKMRRSATADGKTLNMSVATAQFPPVVLGNDAAWTFHYSQVQTFLAPEAIIGNLTLSLT